MGWCPRVWQIYRNISLSRYSMIKQACQCARVHKEKMFLDCQNCQARSWCLICRCWLVNCSLSLQSQQHINYGDGKVDEGADGILSSNKALLLGRTHLDLIVLLDSPPLWVLQLSCLHFKLFPQPSESGKGRQTMKTQTYTLFPSKLHIAGCTILVSQQTNCGLAFLFSILLTTKIQDGAAFLCSRFINNAVTRQSGSVFHIFHSVYAKNASLQEYLRCVVRN